MHKYNNQDHAMMTAMLTARNIMAGQARLRRMGCERRRRISRSRLVRRARSPAKRTSRAATYQTDGRRPLIRHRARKQAALSTPHLHATWSALSGWSKPSAGTRAGSTSVQKPPNKMAGARHIPATEFAWPALPECHSSRGWAEVDLRRVLCRKNGGQSGVQGSLPSSLLTGTPRKGMIRNSAVTAARPMASPCIKPVANARRTRKARRHRQVR